MEEVKDTKFELVSPTEENTKINKDLTYYKDAEWCFQFFAWSAENVEEPTPLVIQLQPHSGENIIFKQNGMEFKIFPRQISEETKKLRQEHDGSKN